MIHKNLKERSENIILARNIIRELQRTIDLENGNNVAKSLFVMYNKMSSKLIKANVLRNASIIDEVLEDLINIRWGFQKAIEIESGLTTLDAAMQERQEREDGTEENAG